MSAGGSFSPNGLIPAHPDAFFFPVVLPANGNDVFNQLIQLPKSYKRITLGAVGGAAGLNSDLYITIGKMPGVPDNVTFATGAIAQLAQYAPDCYPIFDNRCKRIISWEFCDGLPTVLYVSAANYAQGGGALMLIFSNGIRDVNVCSHT